MGAENCKYDLVSKVRTVLSRSVKPVWECVRYLSVGVCCRLTGFIIDLSSTVTYFTSFYSSSLSWSKSHAPSPVSSEVPVFCPLFIIITFLYTDLKSQLCFIYSECFHDSGTNEMYSDTIWSFVLLCSQMEHLSISCSISCISFGDTRFSPGSNTIVIGSTSETQPEVV